MFVFVHVMQWMVKRSAISKIIQVLKTDNSDF